MRRKKDTIIEDHVRKGLRILFVGINPGIRSAEVGHHFAGYSNRFWKLLNDSGLVPEPLTYLDDWRLPEWGLGITNLIARPTPGVADLRPEEYIKGWLVLRAKIRRLQPKAVALVGITLYSTIFGERPEGLGRQPANIYGAQVFVVPNPSGRNAHFSYEQMRQAFAALATID